ncbi:GPR1/FUN34/YaaH family transporter [Amycolatopsis sp.]|uniref:GPR1/FUN34/YaaH family transporter n=1 Tax=Amycolatopsis sp. TaxID=37632 RepID=UPI002BCD3B67|nr:GPR1/FUN34/YaaH family transporter [Amycolatopsis sp.]HVV11037.1 GPR1/FUN34/YaaH family transporter [Amycolatopsis sp.]
MSSVHSNEAPSTPTAHEVRSMVEREAPPAPTGVVVGAGGDPLIIGLPIFAVGSLALGMALIGVVPATALGAVVPIVLFGTGLYLGVVTVWAAMLAQTIVAGITGTFSGFWLSLGALLLGLQHNWYGVAADQVAGVEQLFFIAWGCLFLFLLIPCLRLPAVYPAVVALVVAACALAAAAAHTGDANLLKAAGYVILVFALLGFCAFVNVGLTAMGAKRPFPPLGRPPVG